jgi:FkbH-like protein
VTGEDGRVSTIAIGASFTLGLSSRAVTHFAAQLEWRPSVVTVPYGRLLADLHDPHSTLRRANYRVLAIRDGDPGITRAAFLDAIDRLGDNVPTLIVDCQHGDRSQTQHAETEWVDLGDILAAYGLSHAEDPVADLGANIPLTDAGMAALGTAMARWIDRKVRPPVKLIGVDGDNTLWTGVLGEDGAGGLTLTEGQAQLQAQLCEAIERGQIVSLISKNHSDDIEAMFAARPEFPLAKAGHLDLRLGWSPKSERLGTLMHEYGVGAESIVFLDDNPVECAEMRAAFPDILTSTVPDEALDQFLRNYWPLDTVRATADDLARSVRLVEERARRAAADAAPSLAAFFHTLDLQVEIETATPADDHRISQLTQRTNQFNSSLLRLEEAQLGGDIQIVRVRDRYGDYGLVGVMRGQAHHGALYVDLFLLSCRALGKGVEHRMLRRLAELAQAEGLERLRVQLVDGPRNQPVRQFLNAVAGPATDDDWLDIPLAAALDIRFDPAAATFEEAPTARPAVAAQATRSLTYEALADKLRHTDHLVNEILGPVRSRPQGMEPPRPPTDELESRLVGLWEDLLRVAPIGTEDSFTQLGGTSLDLARLHSRLSRQDGMSLPLGTLFALPTIAELARHLRNPAMTDTGRERAARMRARRMGVRSSTR